LQELLNIEDAHLVKTVLHYSDGTETVINYRGVIVNGVLTEDEPKKKEGIVAKIKKAVNKK